MVLALMSSSWMKVEPRRLQLIYSSYSLGQDQMQEVDRRRADHSIRMLAMVSSRANTKIKLLNKLHGCAVTAIGFPGNYIFTCQQPFDNQPMFSSLPLL